MAIDRHDADSDFDQCFRAASKVGSSMSYRSGKRGRQDDILILVATGRTAQRLYDVVGAAVSLVGKVKAWRS